MFARALLHAILLLVLPVAVGAATPEYRGVWVDGFHAGFKTPLEVKKLVSDVRAAHFNVIFLQVRRRGDVFYNSLYEPKAQEIAPGFDPLAEVIRLAHDTTLGPRIEVHAWLVAFPIWNEPKVTPPARHVLKTHPDWLTRDHNGKTWDGEGYNLDPGHPAVQRHVFSLAMELVARYDLDGLNLDRIRYADNTWGYNPTSLARFRINHPIAGLPPPTEPAWQDFRRGEVTALVRKIYLSAIAQKPGLKISASTITWSPSVSTPAEWSKSAAYFKVLQDWRAWMKEGILDLNVPMDYFRNATARNDFVRWATFAADQSFAHQVIIGCAGYLNSFEESREQIRMVNQVVQTNTAIQGFSLYSYAAPVSTNNITFLAFTGAGTRNPIFNDTAPIPVLPWKSNPWTGHLKGMVRHRKSGATLEGVHLTIGTNELRLVTTDATGFYGAVNLEPGVVKVIAAGQGFMPVTNFVTVLRGKVATLDLVLGPLTGK